MSVISSSPFKAFQPEWRPDAVSDECLGCGKPFSFLCRRHHCRACGELVCADCSPTMQIVPQAGTTRPVRVCKQCSSGSSATSTSRWSPMNYYSGSEGSSDFDQCLPEADDHDDHLMPWAVEVIASHSTQKKTALCYDYFVQSEAVSWIVDAGVVQKRRAAVALFTRMVEEEFVVVKPWDGSKRTVFYMLNNGKCADGASHHGSNMHAQTSKCRNCSQWYLESLTPAPGYCSIDCKTNALISQSDNARIRRLL